MKMPCVNVASILVAISLFFLAPIKGTHNESPIITTKTGQLQGKTVQFTLPDSTATTEVYQFTGIPFAEPPIGKLRFRKTQPVQPWSGVLNATNFANSCTQLYDAKSGEDCLYLNVWVPKARLDGFIKNQPDKKLSLAVFVYIHGGGFMFGSAKNPSDNGRYLSGFNDIIVVTLQYRLGSLGFAYLGNEDVPGNMALWDQVEALKWISENIGTFGGNNKAITIGGESAGAVLISWHLLSKHSRPYFQRAIIQSGSAISIRGKNSAEVALAGTNVIFQQICDQTSQKDKMECLRSVDASKFPMADQKAPGMTFECILRPVFGTDFLLDDPLDVMNSGDFHRIPLLTGSARDEGSYFVPLHGYPPVENLTYDDYNALMFDRFRQYGGDTKYPSQPNPLLIDVIKMHYWPQINQAKPKGVDVFKAVSDAYGELTFTCPTYVFANRTASHGVDDVFVYTFTHERSDSTSPAYMGVKHADEMAFMFGETFAPGNEKRFTEQERQFSRAMMTYWSNFVKSGNPNVGYNSEIPNTLPQWPSFVGNECSEQFFELSALTVVGKKSPTVICELKDRNCLFWYDVVPRLAENTLSPNQPKSSANRIRQVYATLLFVIIVEILFFL